MDIEGVLLTGGASRRMGSDKASLMVAGDRLDERTARELTSVCVRVTVLGRHPVEGYAFVPDAQEYAGPLSALARFQPSSDLVFVASCDLPAFDRTVVEDLANWIGDRQAAIPIQEGREQPLCALYRKAALVRLREMAEHGERRIMAWVSALQVVRVEESNLRNPLGIANANTPEEVDEILRSPNA
jgi:molybdopterin-guanine dinucleotide biosynthesis protein A